MTAARGRELHRAHTTSFVVAATQGSHSFFIQHFQSKDGEKIHTSGFEPEQPEPEPEPEPRRPSRLQ